MPVWSCWDWDRRAKERWRCTSGSSSQVQNGLTGLKSNTRDILNTCLFLLPRCLQFWVATMAKMFRIWHIKWHDKYEKGKSYFIFTFDQSTIYNICLSFAPQYHFWIHLHQTRNPYVNFKTLRILPSENKEIKKKTTAVYISNYKHMKAKSV